MSVRRKPPLLYIPTTAPCANFLGRSGLRRIGLVFVGDAKTHCSLIVLEENNVWTEAEFPICGMCNTPQCLHTMHVRVSLHNGHSDGWLPEKTTPLDAQEPLPPLPTPLPRTYNICHTCSEKIQEKVSEVVPTSARGNKYLVCTGCKQRTIYPNTFDGLDWVSELSEDQFCLHCGEQFRDENVFHYL